MRPVSSLVLSLSKVVALPVKLSSGDIYRLIQVEAPREYSKHVDDSLKVVQVTVNTVGYACVLHFEGHTHAILDDRLVHLADGGCGERVQVDLVEVLLPFLAVFTDQVLGDLLQWHDVSLRTSFLHGFSDDWREDRLFTSTHDLTNFESTSSHLLKIVGKSLCILLIDSVSSHTLLVSNCFTISCFLLYCLCHGSAHELHTEHSKMHCS